MFTDARRRMPALPVPKRKDRGKDALSHNLPPGTAVLPHNNPQSQMHVRAHQNQRSHCLILARVVQCEQVQSVSKLIDCLEVHER